MEMSKTSQRVLKTALSYLLVSGSAQIATCECVEGVPRVSEGWYDRYMAAEGVRSAAKSCEVPRNDFGVVSGDFRRFMMFAEVRTCL
jgi:hypothetical protein